MAIEIHLVTLFPAFFAGPLQESILKRAQKQGQVEITVHNVRDFTHDRHKTADDKPFGGGAGMLLKPEPLFECVEAIGGDPWVILLDPGGDPFQQQDAQKLVKRRKIVLIAGHYEGVDQRVREHLVDQEISIGDFVTMGGEAPALCVIEAVVRLIPGVLGNDASIADESFQSGKLEYPQYTRPRDYRGWKVPEVLVSGDHAQVRRWREAASLELTRKRRPDLLAERPKPRSKAKS